MLELQFNAGDTAGSVSALLIHPPHARWLYVMGHGASSTMRASHLQAIAERLADERIASFRYNFPYAERGTGRNSNAVCMQTIRRAVAAAQSAAPDVQIVAGGHSFSGRMTSLAMSEAPIDGVRGLVFLAFPLHPAGAPATERAQHLETVKVPLLFLSGTRDALAEGPLLQPTCQQLGPRATLHLLDTADHSFKVQKRTRQSSEDVTAEIARVIREWTEQLE